MKKIPFQLVLFLLCLILSEILLSGEMEKAMAHIQSPPRWIWFPEGNPKVRASDEPCFFRKTFDLSPGVAKVILTITADNEYEVYVNGNKVGQGNDWSKADEYDITANISPGNNLISVKAMNHGGPAGLICSIGAASADGAFSWRNSDETWRISNKEDKGWNEKDFDDRKWALAKVIGTLSDPLWNTIDESFGKFYSLKIAPAFISPNGDGLHDTLSVTFINKPGIPNDIKTDIMDSEGKSLFTHEEKITKKTEWIWDGKDQNGQTIPNGKYRCVARMSNSGILVTQESPFTVNSSVQFKEAPNIMKDIFPIGVWFDGRVEGINCPPGYHNVPPGFDNAKKYYEENFSDIKKHNIEIIVIPNTPPDYRETLLAAADKVGVKIVLEIVELANLDVGGRFSVRAPYMQQDETILYEYYKKIITPLMKHPSLFCYQILDEPPANLFDNFHVANRILAHIDPSRPSFSCLCQEHELHRTSKMGTQMIIFDRYPLWKGSKPGEYDFRIFIKLLEMLKESPREIPYWMVVQTCAMDREKGLRYPTPEELRLMVYLSLAHNAKGIFFFLHNSYTQEEKLQGLVDIDLKPQPLYAETAKIAGELKTLSPLLLKLEPVDSIVKYEGNFDVQMFKGKDNKRYMIIANLDVLSSRTFTGVLDSAQGMKIKSLRNVLNKQIAPLENGKFTCDMHPGAGYIFECVNE